MADFVSAVDDILGQFKSYWDAESPAVVGGSAPAIIFEPTEPHLKPEPRDSTAPWARIIVRHNDSNRRTLSGAESRYLRSGKIRVQVFVPGVGAAAYSLGQDLAKVAQRAFEGKRAGLVVFKKASANDRPKDGLWSSVDIVTDFYWTETLRATLDITSLDRVTTDGTQRTTTDGQVRVISL